MTRPRSEEPAAAALAEQGTEEPEWEYGNEQLMNSHVEVFPASSEAVAKAQAWLYPMRRRRKAGPWEPVPTAQTDSLSAVLPGVVRNAPGDTESQPSSETQCEVVDRLYAEDRAQVEQASRAPQPTEDEPLNVEREKAAAEYTRRNVGGMQPVMTLGERVHDAFVSGAEWAAGFRRAPAEPAVTDEMVERGLKVSREFPMKRGLDNARNVMRAVLEAAFATRGADDE